MTNTEEEFEVDLSEAVVVEVGGVSGGAKEVLRDAIDEFQLAWRAPRLAVNEEPYGFRIRVRVCDGLELVQALSDALPGVAFNVRAG